MLRFIIAFIVCKATYTGLRLLGRRASHTPGRIALHICPDYIRYLKKPKHILCVTGTNGKSTVCNLLEDALRTNGYTVLDNKFGSNTENGIAVTMTRGVTIFNRCKYDDCVLEVDERSSTRIFRNIHPDYLIVVDLFRDSCKRNAHPDFISDIITNAVPDDTVLILNADDVIGSRVRIDGSNRRIHFSVLPLEGESAGEPNIINDAGYCPVCGGVPEFTFRRYHHIGHFRCPSCGLQNPESDHIVTGIDAQKKELYAEHNGKAFTYPLIQASAFNVYNEIAAISLLLELGLTPEQIAKSLKNIKVTDSRYYEKQIGDVKFISHVVKGLNPVALSVVSNYVKQIEGDKSVFMFLDDNVEIKIGCENLTWYYEADLERLADDSVKHIYISGFRAEDMKYRLLLAGVPEDRMTTFHEPFDITKIADFSKAPTFIMLFELYVYDEQMKLRKELEEKIEEFGRERK
ncbi:MAG: DUF1727 domain-containing protein [Ruminococcaceae bacterium]|nr:DUF1727 domain-containing protein [Oscillospiraceae bacterium]